MTSSESPTHPDAPRADEARDDECGLLHPNGVFCDRPMGHVGSHAAYSDSPELCLSWGARSVDAPRAGGETPDPLTVLAERAAYTIERLRAVSESVNAGHDRYIPNDADDAADLIAELRAALLDGERDTDRLDWIQETFDGTGHTLSMGGVCYWGLDMQRGGPRSKITRISEGQDLREAIDEAMSAPPSPERASAILATPPAASPEPTVNSNDR